MQVLFYDVGWEWRLSNFASKSKSFENKISFLFLEEGLQRKEFLEMQFLGKTWRLVHTLIWRALFIFLFVDFDVFFDSFDFSLTFVKSDLIFSDFWTLIFWFLVELDVWFLQKHWFWRLNFSQDFILN